MKQWIAGGLVVMLLLLMGAGFGYRAYRQNRPAPVWIPLPINPKLPAAKCDELVGTLKTELSKDKILRQVSMDLKLAEAWDLPSEEAAAGELCDRLFVKFGDADTPMGKVPAIHVGVTGKNKDREVSSKIAVRLVEDVWKILGIDPPPKQEP